MRVPDVWIQLVAVGGLLLLILRDRRLIPRADLLTAKWRKLRILVAIAAMTVFMVNIGLIVVGSGWRSITLPFLLFGGSIAALFVTTLAIHAADVARKYTLPADG